jgi:hypothetical protein
VHSISISAVRPIDVTAERNLVPVPTGPGVIFSARTIWGLYCGSLLWSATKSNTSSTGRPIRISPSILAMPHLHVVSGAAPVRRRAFQLLRRLALLAVVGDGRQQDQREDQWRKS